MNTLVKDFQPAIEVIQANEFKDAMRWLTGGVTVITTLLDGKKSGLTATAVCSVCAEPASILVCINSNGETHDKISESGVLCVNALSSQQSHIAEVFAGMKGDKGEARFAHGEWTTLVTQSPVLQESLISLDCIIAKTIRQGTHSIFICNVVGSSRNVDQGALAYLNCNFLKL